MDKKIIFVKTGKGEDEFKNKTSQLFGDIKRALGLVDDKSTVEELKKRAAPSLRASFDAMLKELVEGGFILDKEDGAARVVTSKSAPRMSTLKMAMPAVQAKDSGEDLDFTSAMPKLSGAALAAEEDRLQAQVAAQEQARRAKFELQEKARAEADAKAKQQAEVRAGIEAEAFRLKAEQEAAKVMTELNSAQAKAEDPAKAQARVEAETVRIRAEEEAAQAKAKQQAEAQARAEAEAARLKAEEEAAQAKAKQQAEAQARAEAETARLRAEEEAAQAKAALAAIQAKARQEAETKARAEAEAARLKAEEEAAQAKAALAAVQAKARQEAETKARADAEAARLKAEQEEAKLLAELAEIQARTKAEAEAKAHAASATHASHQAKAGSHIHLAEDRALKARADDEVRQLTESQAKVWAEAEQRAKVQAEQADAMQHMAQKTEKAAPAKVVKSIVREAREPLPLGKISGGLLGLSVVLAVLLPYVWPMQEYIVQIEHRLSAQLHQPVHIAHLYPSLLPLPQLELRDVVVGSGQELKASSVILHFNIVTLFTDTKAIGLAEFSDLTLRAESFEQTLSWMQAAGGDTMYPITQMELQRARINGEGLNLPLLHGVVDFDGHGHLLKSVMHSEDSKLSIELQPQQSRWQIKLSIKESNLPLVPGITFDELNVRGEAFAGVANFSVIEGALYKGKLLGNARLTWKNGWQLQGQLNVKAWALQDVLPQSAMTGDMDGTANITLRATQLPLLARDAHLDGRFSVKKGYISSIDMVETARVSNRQNAATGRTNFDELSGTLLLDGNSLQLHQIRISAGVMSATGFVDVVSGKQLSGRLNVDLKMRAELGSMPLTLSGTLTEPVWRTGR